MLPLRELASKTAAHLIGLVDDAAGDQTGEVTEISALLVAVPEADPVVGSLRADLDSGAGLGVPAHITILYPFMPTSLLSSAVIAELGDLVASLDSFEFTLTSIGWFDHDVVYLRPEPDAALQQMTALVLDRWPQWPPYGGRYPDPTPHLTLGDNGDVAAMSRAADEVLPHLPLVVEVGEVQLYTGIEELGTWRHRLSFPLGT